LAAVAIALIAVLTAPLPHRVTVPAVLQPQAASRVFVPVAGRLTWAIASGTTVRRGDVLGRLESPELDLELARLRGQREVLLSQLQSLKSRSAQQTQRGVRDSGSAVPTAEQALADTADRLRRREEERQRLTLTAPVAGTVLPPRSRREPSAPGELPSWSGRPLDPANRDAFLDTGTLFCLVGDPHSLEALLLIDQAEIAFVQAGQPARIQIDQLPGRFLTGRIQELSQIDADALPPELVAAGRLPLAEQAQGQTELVGVYYQARLALDPHPYPLLPGATGRARIEVAPRSLGRRLVRYLSSTFRLGV
jgi:putative peptide zinc metalloprotease protein